MPQLISKTMAINLFDEEVEAWQVLETYLLTKNRTELLLTNSPKVSSRRMLRELLRLAAEHLSAEIGPEVAESLRKPPAIPQFLLKRSALQRKAKPESKGHGRKTGEKPKPAPAAKSTRRVYWNRPYKDGAGDAG